MQYKVLLSDPFYGNKSHVYSNAATALAAARKIVDSFLTSVYRPGMTVAELIDAFENFGEQPLIVSSEKPCRFSASDYALEKARELCTEPGENNGTFELQENEP